MSSSEQEQSDKTAEEATPETRRERKNLFSWRVPNEDERKSKRRPATVATSSRVHQLPAATSPPHPAPPVTPAVLMAKVPSASSSTSTSATTATSEQKPTRETKSRRHWRFLFTNFRAALDEMLEMCSMELSIDETVAVIETLRYSLTEFTKLRQKLEIILEFDQEDSPLSSPHRGGVAWEEQKPVSSSSLSRPNTAPERLDKFVTGGSSERTSPVESTATQTESEYSRLQRATQLRVKIPQSPGQAGSSAPFWTDTSKSPGLGFSHAMEVTCWADDVEREEAEMAKKTTVTISPQSPLPPPEFADHSQPGSPYQPPSSPPLSPTTESLSILREHQKHGEPEKSQPSVAAPVAPVVPQTAVIPPADAPAAAPPATAAPVAPVFPQTAVIPPAEAPAAAPPATVAPVVPQTAVIPPAEAPIVPLPVAPPVAQVSAPASISQQPPVPTVVQPPTTASALTAAPAHAPVQQRPMLAANSSAVRPRTPPRTLGSRYIPNQGDTFAERVKKSLPKPAQPQLQQPPAVPPPQQLPSQRTPSQRSPPKGIPPAPGTCPSKALQARLTSAERPSKQLDQNAIAERQEKAKQNREHIVQEKMKKARRLSDRTQQASERQTKKIFQRQQALEGKHEKAEQLHESFIRQVVQKAEKELDKVKEVAWLSSEQLETQKFVAERELSTKLEDAAARKAGLQEEARQKAIQRAAKGEATVMRKAALRQIPEKEKAKRKPKKSMPASAPSATTPEQSPAVVAKEVCTLCDKEISPAEGLQAHLESEGHVKRLKEKEAPAPEQKPEAPMSPKKTRLPTPEKTPERDGGRMFIVRLPPTGPIRAALSDEDRTALEAHEQAAMDGMKAALEAITATSEPEPKIENLSRDSPYAHMAKLNEEIRAVFAEVRAAPQAEKQKLASNLELSLAAFKSLVEKPIDAKVKPQGLLECGAVTTLADIACCSLEATVLRRASGIAAEIIEVVCRTPTVGAALLKTTIMPRLLAALDSTALGDKEHPCVLPMLRVAESCLNSVPLGSPRRMQVIEFVLRSVLIEKIYLRMKLGQQGIRSPTAPHAAEAVRTNMLLDEGALGFVVSLSTSPPERSVCDPPALGPLVDSLRILLSGLPSLMLSLLLTNARNPQPSVRPQSPSAPPASVLPFGPLPGHELSPRRAPMTDAALRFVRIGLRLLNNVAQLNLGALQAVFTPKDLALELYHLLAFVLHSTVGSPESRQALTEAILLIGHLALGSPTLRELFRWGSPSILQTLCSLPIQYFCDPTLREVLLPTLACTCFEDPSNSELLASEVNPTHIADFLESQSPPTNSVVGRVYRIPSSHIPDESRDTRCLLSRRFPVADAAKASAFFRALAKK